MKKMKAPSTRREQQHGVNKGPQAHKIPKRDKNFIHFETIVTFQVQKLLQEIQVRWLQISGEHIELSIW